MRTDTNVMLNTYEAGYEAGKAGARMPVLPQQASLSENVLCHRGWTEGRAVRGDKSHYLLGELAHYLLRNYEDDQWDSTTRELLEETSEHMGWGKIEWNIDEEDDE